jgi:hypothetical protein
LAGGAVGVPVLGGMAPPPVGGAEPVGGTTGGAPDGPVLVAVSPPPPLQPASSAKATMLAQRVRLKTAVVVLVPLIVLLL